MSESEEDALILAMTKKECETDGIYFNRLFFKQTFGSKMIVAPHHKVIQSALERTMLPSYHPDAISRLIINIPPGFGKTSQATINYIARGLALNPQARFLHLSYSANLALQNSFMVRELVKSRFYQQMWPIQIKDDADSKQLWWTESMGGCYATATGSQITGFRAGHMDTGKFTGALIIDDGNKVDDANYESRLKLTNSRYNETIASRLAVESVPVIVIQQRIHYNDLSGYLLRGGSGEKWHHLNLPVKIKHGAEYPEQNTHGIPIEHDIPEGWLWEYKLNDKHEAALKAHRSRYRAQYLQNPIRRNEEFALWTDALLEHAKGEPHMAGIKRTVVAVDPAASNTKTSDMHGIVVAAQHDAKDQYTVLADRTCKGSPMEWAEQAIAAYHQFEADAIVAEVNMGGQMVEQTLRNAGFKGRVVNVHAAKGKIARAEPIAALYEQGMVRHNDGLSLLEDEMLDLDSSTGKSNGKSPNRVDALVWALTQLSQGQEMSRLLRLVVGGN